MIDWSAEAKQVEAFVVGLASHGLDLAPRTFAAWKAVETGWSWPENNNPCNILFIANLQRSQFSTEEEFLAAYRAEFEKFYKSPLMPWFNQSAPGPVNDVGMIVGWDTIPEAADAYAALINGMPAYKQLREAMQPGVTPEAFYSALANSAWGYHGNDSLMLQCYADAAPAEPGAPAAEPTQQAGLDATVSMTVDAFSDEFLFTLPAKGSKDAFTPGFQLDTGCAFAVFLNKGTADQLGVPNLGALNVAGVTGSAAAYKTEVQLQIGSEWFTLQGAVDETYAGWNLLGAAFLINNNLTLVVDVETKKLRFTTQQLTATAQPTPAVQLPQGVYTLDQIRMLVAYAERSRADAHGNGIMMQYWESVAAELRKLGAQFGYGQLRYLPQYTVPVLVPSDNSPII